MTFNENDEVVETEKSKKIIKRSKTFFFLDERMYRYMNQNRALGIVEARDVDLDKTVLISWSDFKNKAYWAYTLSGTGYLLNRHWRTILRLVQEGHVTSVKIVESNIGARRRYYFNHTAIKEAYRVLSINRKGAQKKDGVLQKIKKIPTPEELDSQLKHEVVLYARTKKGEFVRVWAAEDWD